MITDQLPAVKVAFGLFFTHPVDSRVQVGERVSTLNIRLGRSNHNALFINQFDSHFADRRFAGILNSILILICPNGPGNRS